MRKIFGSLLFIIYPLLLSAQDNNVFDIIFMHDFEANELGYYDNQSWSNDWFNPGWRDSEHNNGDPVEIVKDAQTGSKVMEFEYPKGAVSPSAGNTSDGVYTPGGGDYWNSYWGSSEKELYFSYNVKFKPGFLWNHGGKLPGINGGPMYEGAKHPTEDQGFSCILMFHPGEVMANNQRDPDGRIKFYLYHQDNKVERYADSRIWDDHGDQHVFNTSQEQWYNITIRVVVNSFSPDASGNLKANYDGIVEGFINGQLKESWTGLRLLHEVNSDRGIEGMIMASFFGGAESYMGALRDEWAYFDDFYLFKYDESVNVPRGNTPSPAGRVLTLPNSDKIEGVAVEQDIQAPTVPANLQASEITENSVKLSWNASTDNVSIKGYDIYMNGNKKKSVFTTSEVITGLSPSTQYKFEVLAYDPSFNNSAKSKAITITTKEVTKEKDLLPPSIPTGLKANEINQNSVSLSWNASSDNVGVAGYKIYANGLRKATVGGTSYVLDRLNPGILYNIHVTAYDAAGNESNPSAILKITTLQDNPGDDKNPGNPEGIDDSLPEVSVVKVNNSPEVTETVTQIRALRNSELLNMGVRVAKDENFSKEVEVISATRPECMAYQDERVSDNLQVLYNFAEGEGNLVRDVSNAGEPVDLVIDDPASVQWLPGQGMKVNNNTLISSEAFPARLGDAISRTNEVSFEAWIKPDVMSQAGPARIITLSTDQFNRTFTIGQQGSDLEFDYVARLRTSNTDENGVPEGYTSRNYYDIDYHHLVYTRTGEGIEKIYVDGEQVYYGFREGEIVFSETDRLALANELTGDRPWTGTYYLVAAYNRALEESEIIQNYNAGFGRIEFKTSFENLEAGGTYFMEPFVETDKGILYGEAVNVMIPDEYSLDESVFNTKVYPNPSKGDFTLYFENDSYSYDIEYAWIRVMDVTGKLIYYRELQLTDIFFGREEQISLEPEKIQNGFYFVTVTIGDTSETQKLMINK